MKWNKLIWLLITVTLLWLISLVVEYFIFDSWDESSVFGDSFGAINSLFTGLAFGGVIFTIFLQKEELSLQRKELELTRKELKRTAEAQEKSEKALKEQVDSLKLTAKLNALNTYINYRSRGSYTDKVSSIIQDAITQKGLEKYIKMIKSIIDVDIENDN